MADIKIDTVNKYYGDVHVIKDVSLDIKSQSFTVLVGPSGCGKSTMLRMIAGLEDIHSGTISIDGQVVNDLPPKQRNIAMVFQSYALYPHMTVFDNMAFGLKLEKRSKDEINERVQEAARILQIEDYLHRKPKQLSGGQRQRVAIGRAITRKPKVFLFDEPLSNLDAALRVQMRVELAKLHDQLNATMIYVTHDQTEAMTLANDIVVLDEGIVSQNGSPMDLYKNPNNLFVGGFIGSPKMNFISSKILSKSNESTEVDLMGGSKIIVPKTSASASEGDSVELGIRPEHLTVNADGDGSWESKVFVVEKLGSGTYLYLEKEGEPLVVETEGDSNVKVGDIVKVGFDASRCHLFDSSKQAFK
ncbi:MAG: sn-glycerol-3-phosphate ABC transporter ATP-binding protein UgpC [Pelagibacteraceae bacterium]|nr:sn-glycerol-3-phosphate ABC transporter ATP-binding protein UgpC [Pelagibacteraceae bacterium]MBT4645918.1 sn-glycerol-3-phosphate ABC transporter ATP-binding protein UgpC [Pelagibacteraceae bacterium]MBT4951592.1 sn-glycerol-3-phosphate ABC transporter ATP-binding protein UgpC [Pelagibacteraceae bacterium]